MNISLSVNIINIYSIFNEKLEKADVVYILHVILSDSLK